MEFGAIALAVMAAFTGIILYGVYVEQPSRRDFLDADLLAHWRRGFPRGKKVLAALSLAGCFFGLVGLLWAKKGLYLTGSLFSIADWVLASKWITPVTDKLMATNPDTADAGSRALLEKWNMLQSLRAGLGFLAALSFFAAL